MEWAPSPHPVDNALSPPATVRRSRSFNSPSDALPLTQLSDSSPGRVPRDSPKISQKPLIDVASGYVPEIEAPPSVGACSGHRCVRGRSGPWCFCARGPSPSPSPKKKDDAEPRSPTDAPKRDPVVYEGEPNGPLRGRVGRALSKATRAALAERVYKRNAVDEREAFASLAGGRYMCARLDKRCWLEVTDKRHRYAKNLRRYHYEWVRRERPKGDFFAWLDAHEEPLQTCTREKLETEVVRYCSKDQARKYRLRCVGGLVYHLKTDEHHHLSGRERDASRDRRRHKDGDVRPRHRSPVARRSFDDREKPRHRSPPREPTEAQKNAPSGYAPLNTGPKGWIFVLHDGGFYARRKGTAAGKARFHHSSFFGGECVDAAGIVVAKDGIVQRILPHSGHYRPREAHFGRLLIYVRDNMGLALDGIEVDVQRVLRIARPEHARKMDTPHFWSASHALSYLTHKAVAKLSNLFHAIENRGALESLRRRDATLAAAAAAAMARGTLAASRVASSVRRTRRPSEDLTDRTTDVLEAFDESTGPFVPRRHRANSGVLPPDDAHLQTITADTFPTDVVEAEMRPVTPPPRLPEAPPASRSAPSSAQRPSGRPRLSPRIFDEPPLLASPASPPPSRGRLPLPTSPPPAPPWPRGGPFRMAPGSPAASLAAAPPPRRRARSAERRDARDVVGATSRARYRRRGDAAALLGLREDPAQRRARTAAVAAAVAAADDSVLEEARDHQHWWEGESSPAGLALRRKKEADDDEARNDDGAADSSDDDDNDGSDSDSDGSDGSSSDYSGDEGERRPRRLGFKGSSGALSTLGEGGEASPPPVTESDSPGGEDDDDEEERIASALGRVGLGARAASP